MKNINIVHLFFLLFALVWNPVYAQETPDYDKVITLLETAKLPSVSFQDDSMQSVLSWLSTITQIEFISTDLLTEEDETVTIALQEGTSARSFVKLLADLRNIRFHFKEGIVLAATKDEIVQKPILKIYSVDSLNIQIPDFPGPEIMLDSGDGGFDLSGSMMDTVAEPMTPDEIMDIIKEFTGGSSWDDVDGIESLVRGSQLLIKQTAEVHAEIAQLLDMLGD